MNKEDITRRTKELITNDCVLDKKRLRCVEHDCVLKVVNVSNQNGSGLKGKRNLVTKQGFQFTFQGGGGMPCETLRQ